MCFTELDVILDLKDKKSRVIKIIQNSYYVKFIVL